MDDADSNAYEDEHHSLPSRVLTPLLNPVLASLELLFSRPAIKAYISTALFVLTSIALLTISTTAYLTFYYNYIPQINLERPIYLQYASSPPYPHATTPLDTSALIAQQQYDVDIVLHMPLTPSNLQAGNFMLDLALIPAGSSISSSIPEAIASLLQNGTTPALQRSRRPAILPYSSQLLTFTHTLLHLPWHLLSFRDLDSLTVVVPMFELVEFERSGRNVPSAVRLEIQSDKTVQIYSAKIVFRARFRGLRYYIYNYRLTAYALFTAVFYSVSVCSMGVAWLVGSSLISRSGDSQPAQTKRVKQEPENEIKQEPESDRKVKTEPPATERGQGTEMTEGQFPTLRGQMPLRYQDRPDIGINVPSTPSLQDHPVEEAADDEDEDEQDYDDRGRIRAYDSGIGTSMESENAASASLRKRSSRQNFTPETGSASASRSRGDSGSYQRM